MLLCDVIHGLLEQCGTLDKNIDITGIAYDSRKVQPGYLFICITGFKTDGHDYVQTAISKGAAAIVAEKDIGIRSIPVIRVQDSRKVLAIVSAAFYNQPSSKFKLVGITGTNGKTTSTYLIKNILEKKGYKVGLIGTNQNMIGDKILPAERTTPESLELQQLFADMAANAVDFVVMEVSSHSLELHRVEGCHFEVGVFTNLTQDHLDFHGTMENYLKAKSKLFFLANTGIINGDDSSCDLILKSEACRFQTYGIDKAVDIKAEDVHLSARGVQFRLVTPNGSVNIDLGIPGKFSVYNALGSIGAGIALGIDLETIREGLKDANGVQGRAQLVETGKDFTVMIDYAHTPDGLINILNTVKDFAKGRVVTLFGCGGDRDITKRPIMGKVAGELSNFCIVTSDNPRTEDPSLIIKHIEEGIKDTGTPYIVIENRYDAIQYALDNAIKDDVIVIAGKGHENYQEINGIKRPFDEKAIVENIVKSGA